MHHTLVRVQYPDLVEEAARLSLDEALDQFLQVYLPQAIYANPAGLAKDLKDSCRRSVSGFCTPAGGAASRPDHLAQEYQRLSLVRPGRGNNKL